MTDTLVPPTEVQPVPARHGRALLGWVNEPEVRILFQAMSVTSPATIDTLVAESRAKRQAISQLAVVPSPHRTLNGVPAQLQTRADALRSTEQFRSIYEPFGAKFAMLPLNHLVTPQWWVDRDYVADLAASAPTEDDFDALFDFSFSVGRLSRPMFLGLNGAAFASARGDIGIPGPLRIANYSPEKVTFEFDVIPRPNWVWIAAIADINRILIINGVHHLLALLQAGHKNALCLVRPANTLGDLLANGWNPQEPALFKPNELGSSRPPLLRDYLDYNLASEVALHLRQSYLRVAVQADPGIIPSIE